MSINGNLLLRRTVVRHLAAMAVLACVLLPQQTLAEKIDGIVAVVDDTVIMYSDVIRKMEELGAKEFDLNSASQVLQIMVEDAVVNKVYKRLGLQPVDIRHAEQAARDMNIDVASARSMIMKSTLMDLMVKSRVVITDAMIQEYYDGKKEYAGSESIHLQQILIKGDSERAARAMDQIRNGTAFEEVAADYSDILVSGSPDIGWVSLKDLAQDAHRALETVQPGDVAGPVRIGDSIIIFKVVERGISGGRPLDEVKAEIVEALQEKYRKEAFEHWLSMIMAEHYIGIYL